MKRFLLLLLVAFVVPSVYAAASSTVFSAIDNEILPNETASFQLTISNFDNSAKRFQVYTIDPNWVSKVEPVRVSVGPGTSEEFIITLKPKVGVPFGSQGITINVKDLESGDLIRKNLFVAVKSYDSISGTFVTSVAYDIRMPAQVDPREPVQFSVHLRNRNPLDIRGMTMRFNSPHYAHEEIIDLEPLAEKTLYFTFTPDPREEPGVYQLSGTLLYKNATVNQVQRIYTIIPYADIVREETKDSFIFRKQTTITLENIGNAPETVRVQLPANGFARLFSNPAPETEYAGAYTWDISIAPGERKEVVLVTNYRWPLGFILLVLIALLLYYIYRSPVVTLKEVVSMAHGEGVSDLKIRIFIKNRSNKVIQGVEVFDKVPRIAELAQTHALGTIKPSKINKLKSGTVLKWDLDVLEPYEERILTYTLQSKLKIVGKVNLPQAKTKFETRSGQERIVYSNNLMIVERK